MLPSQTSSIGARIRTKHSPLQTTTVGTSRSAQVRYSCCYAAPAVQRWDQGVHYDAIHGYDPEPRYPSDLSAEPPSKFLRQSSGGRHQVYRWQGEQLKVIRFTVNSILLFFTLSTAYLRKMSFFGKFIERVVHSRAFLTCL